MSFFRDLLIERKRKPYYCEVEYLESTGTQWIDTKTPDIDKVEFAFSVSNNSADVKLFGNNKAYPGYFVLALYQSKFRGTTIDVLSNTWYNIKIDTTSTPTLYVNEDTATSWFGTNPSGTPDTQYGTATPFIGWTEASGTNYNGNYVRTWVNVENEMSIKYFRGYKGGVLIRDLIPVLDWNMTPCMYDKVTRKLFYNQGTGNFSYGREIHPVEYIEAENGGGSTIVEYAVGNYRLTNTTDWEITFSAENSNNSWVMGQPTWIGVHYRKDTTTSNLPRVGITNGAASANQCYVDYTDNEKITLALKGTDVYANGVKAGSITRASAGATQTEYGIFAYKDISQELPNLRIQSARIYRLKIWDNGVLVQDLIPAIDENGVGGFFENVSRTFIEKESNSTSEFSYPPVELDYLESTGAEYIDTGIKFDCANTKIELKTYENDLSRVHSICGDDGNCFYYFRGTGNWAVGYNYTASNVSSYMVVGDNVFVIDKNKVYLNGVLATTYTASSAVSSYNALLFNRKTSLVDKGAVTMYYCKIWDNDSLVRDYIPVFKDGQAGFLNKVDGTFFTNSGTGQFLTGKIIESRWF